MRKVRNRSRRRQRGITFVELLMAGLLLSIGLMAIVQTWTYSFLVTLNTDDKTIAYNLGRQAIERAKTSGYFSAAEGTTTQYYTGNQVYKSTSTGSRYKVVTYIASDVMQSGTSGQTGAVPATYALRAVTVTVSLTSGGSPLYQTSTYLCRAGI